MFEEGTGNQQHAVLGGDEPHSLAMWLQPVHSLVRRALGQEIKAPLEVSIRRRGMLRVLAQATTRELPSQCLVIQSCW